MSSVNPQFAAKHIAGLLEGDPVMARLVKEHISQPRLREVLELCCASTVEEGVAHFSKEEIAEWVAKWRDENEDAPDIPGEDN